MTTSIPEQVGILDALAPYLGDPAFKDEVRQAVTETLADATMSVVLNLYPQYQELANYAGATYGSYSLRIVFLTAYIHLANYTAGKTTVVYSTSVRDWVFKYHEESLRPGWMPHPVRVSDLGK